ncbi:MAG TPA: glycosyl hydrolase [Thermoanaerobaculia bacterium]|nr:glycosyl hydrolase [Thermoanaerobaculia bacterium]
MPMRLVRLPLVSILVFLLAAAPGLAAKPAPVKKEPPTEAKPPGLVDPPELKAIKYRLLGPAWGGRVARVTGVPGDPSVYYAATASGGVWKSVDGGASFNPVFDEQPVSSMGSIAVAASDPNVVYAGSGEANIRGNVGAGNGIYKSVDAGKTWTHVWVQEGQIGQIEVHPKNPDVAFAAVLGHAFGPNPERGVYRTRDGGKTWQQVLKKDADTGASAVTFDPTNPHVLFAGLWQARRFPWDLTSGGPGSGLYVSRDDGDTWTQLTAKGLPEGIWGKVGVAVAPSDPRRVYALIEAEKGGLYRSDDGGETWSLASGNHELRQRFWYYGTLAVSPANPDEVWVPQVPMLKSIDGGKMFDHVAGMPHGDNHDVWFDPLNAKRMIACDDGGVYISNNGGQSWLWPPLPIGQFYHVAVDNRVPFRVAGALQDIGTAQGPSDSLTGRGIRNTDWYGVGGGEAGWIVSDAADPDIVYAGEYLGYLSRYDHRTGESRNVSPWPENPSGHGGEDMRYRFQWTAPIAASPHDPKVIYYGGNVIFRTADGGQTWTVISPDLTRNDKSKQKWAGGPITGDNTGVETYDTVFVIAESPVQKDLLWAGSDDGLVHVSEDGGKAWRNVTAALPGLPQWGTVVMIEPSHFDAGTAYLVVDAHRLDDSRPYLWKTADFGRTWKRLDGTLPRDVYLHAVREDPTRRGLLYLATERGVDFSRDDGATWQALKLNLPTVAVHDLAVKDDKLVLATHGRSMWIFDDLTVLRAPVPAPPPAAGVYLYPVPETVRWELRGGAADRWNSPNPVHGARFYYWLAKEPKGEVTAQILDAAGTVVANLSSKAQEPTGSTEYVKEEKEQLTELALPKGVGVQRGVWNLAWDGAEMIPKGVLDSGYPGIGPEAVPGSYTLRLTVDGQTVTAPFVLRPDPRVAASQDDLEAQLRFSLQIRDAITRLTRDVVRLQTVRRQLAERNELLAKDERAKALIDSSTALVAKLDDLEGRMHNPKAEIAYDVLAQRGGAKLYSRMSPFLGWVITGNGAPTQGAQEVFAAQSQELAGFETELDKLLKDVAALNEAAAKLGVPGVYVPAAK